MLNAVLRHEGVAVRITEVEAYAGADDPGSHAFRGPTPRNRVMFGPPGQLYVYFVYGMHHCCNIVVGPEGEAAAVLLRAGEVVEGLDLARARRSGSLDRDLARGPARLCTALGIDRSHNGLPLRAAGLDLVLPDEAPLLEVHRGPRVGLAAAPDRPWRFWLSGDLTVSPYRRSPRAAVRSRSEG